MSSYLLSCLWLTPLIGALGLGIIPLKSQYLPRTLWISSSTISAAVFILALILWWGFNPEETGLQYHEHVVWLPTWHIHYTLGIDGIALPFVILTAVIFALAFLVAPHTVTKDLKTFIVLLLISESACLAAFVFHNIFLFYIAFESILIPMALMIGLFGGENRVRAAVTFFLYTFSGSLFLLLALIVCAHHSQTGDMTALTLNTLPIDRQQWIWLGFFLAFAIKLPLVPFHTWLPLAHVEAPTIGSVILAALLLKMGGYGLIRFPLALLPQASLIFQPLVYGLSAVSMIYGSWVAFSQTDLKKLIAYSSVAHMGYVTLGICTGLHVGVQGALFQMISHGLISGALFLGVGILYVRFHQRDLAFFGGLKAVMPLFSTLFMALMLGSMALPGTSGFVGEFLVLLATASTWGATLTLLAGLGMIGSAAYGLKCIHALFFGPVSSSLPQGSSALYQLKPSESFVLWVLTLSIVALGLYPETILGLSRTALTSMTP